MKNGMHSCVLGSYSPEEALMKAGSLGYDGFEIDVSPILNTRAKWREYRDCFFRSIPFILKKCIDADIEVNSLCLGVLWFVSIAGNDEQERGLGIEIIKDSIKLADELGARILLIPVGQPSELFPGPARKNLIRSLKECMAEAEKRHVVLAVENVVQRLLWDWQDLCELTDSIGSEYCKVYYDVGNPYFVGINPADEIIRLGSQRICQVHVKDMQSIDTVSPESGEEKQDDVVFRGDASNWSGKKTATIGKGVVGWSSVVNALRQICYDGYLVLEVHQDPQAPDLVAEQNIKAMKMLGL